MKNQLYASPKLTSCSLPPDSEAPPPLDITLLFPVCVVPSKRRARERHASQPLPHHPASRSVVYAPPQGCKKTLSKMGFDERWLGALCSSLQCSDGVVSEEGRGGEGTARWQGAQTRARDRARVSPYIDGRQAGNLGQGQRGPPVTAPALPPSP
ncbi:hypothetical protein BN1708_010313, partial [Verticillium longisporum]